MSEFAQTVTCFLKDKSSQELYTLQPNIYSLLSSTHTLLTRYLQVPMELNRIPYSTAHYLAPHSSTPGRSDYDGSSINDTIKSKQNKAKSDQKDASKEDLIIFTLSTFLTTSSIATHNASEKHSDV